MTIVEVVLTVSVSLFFLVATVFVCIACVWFIHDMRGGK